MKKPYRLPWYKRLFQHRGFQHAATWCLARLLRLCWLSFRLQYLSHPKALPYLLGEAPAIFCFWHGRMILLPFLMPKGRRMMVLISHHRDGELIARLIGYFGVESIRGSTSRGARHAATALLQALRAGHNVGITPDGPRGPVYEAQRGALHLARQSGCPIIPVSFSASGAKQLKSWDRFLIPLPFSRVRFIIDAPINVAAQTKLSGLQEHKAQLEQVLNDATRRADRVRAA